MRLVWREGRIAGADAPAFAAHDPSVRGLGLVETMRAGGGRIAWLGRHLDRMRSSAADLGLRPFPTSEQIGRAVGELLDAAGHDHWRVRITASAAPSLVVDLAPAPAASDDGVAAVTVRGGWIPGRRLAEHKTTSYGDYLLAQREAESAGADHALLLDDAGRMGEAALANAFCVVDGVIVTAPARGLLPGLARAEILSIAQVEVRDIDEGEWRGASEIFLTNALRGAAGVVSVDGQAVGDGRVGPVTDHLTRGLDEASG